VQLFPALAHRNAPKIKIRVDNTLGQITTRCGEKHFVNLRAIRFGSTEGTGDGEIYNQPKENFGDSLHWVKHVFTRVEK